MVRVDGDFVFDPDKASSLQLVLVIPEINA